jgi:hypothetical protein
MEQVPGIVYTPANDPLPFDYSATLGSLASFTCSSQGEEAIRCMIYNLDENMYGTTQTLSLFVSGCNEPIYQAEVDLPSLRDNRCEVFDDIPMVLHLVAAAPGYLELAVEMPGGVPGLEVDYDGLPAGYKAFIYSYETGQYLGTNNCALNPVRPNRVYCSFVIPAKLMNTSLQFSLQYDNCTFPVFSQDLVASDQKVPSTNQGDDDGGADDATIACNSCMDASSCVAAGGTVNSGATQICTRCSCP